MHICIYAYTVLRLLRHHLLVAMYKANSAEVTVDVGVPPLSATFCKEGETYRKSTANTSNLLSQANDWRMAIDLPECKRGRSPLIPPEIICTSQRPDIFLWSKKIKTAIALELTCPIEENVIAARRRKVTRYMPALIASLQRAGWQAQLLTLEIGSCGFVACSARHALRTIGVSHLSRVLSTSGMFSRRCSYFIWLSRNNREWHPVNIDNLD